MAELVIGSPALPRDEDRSKKKLYERSCAMENGIACLTMLGPSAVERPAGADRAAFDRAAALLQTSCDAHQGASCAVLGLLARYGRSVTCVAFMGGDAGPHKIARLAGTVRKTCPELRTAWYSGREELPEGFEAAAFDYVKLGGWVEALGPLTAPTTNQRLYRIEPDGTMEDITKLFRRKP